jgi:hypothetical protein
MADPDRLEPDEDDGTKDIDESASLAAVVPTGLPDELDEVEEAGEGDDDEAPND